MSEPKFLSVAANERWRNSAPSPVSEYSHPAAPGPTNLPPGGAPERLVDAEVIAAHLAIPRKTVLQYARDGRLPCVRIGRHVRFRLSDIDEYVRGSR